MKTKLLAILGMTASFTLLGCKAMISLPKGIPSEAKTWVIEDNLEIIESSLGVQPHIKGKFVNKLGKKISLLTIKYHLFRIGEGGAKIQLDDATAAEWEIDAGYTWEFDACPIGYMLPEDPQPTIFELFEVYGTYLP